MYEPYNQQEHDAATERFGEILYIIILVAIMSIVACCSMG